MEFLLVDDPAFEFALVPLPLLLLLLPLVPPDTTFPPPISFCCCCCACVTSSRRQPSTNSVTKAWRRKFNNSDSRSGFGGCSNERCDEDDRDDKGGDFDCKLLAKCTAEMKDICTATRRAEDFCLPGLSDCESEEDVDEETDEVEAIDEDDDDEDNVDCD